MKLYIAVFVACAAVVSAQSIRDRLNNMLQPADDGFRYTCPITGNQMSLSGTRQSMEFRMASPEAVLHIGRDGIALTTPEGTSSLDNVPEEVLETIGKTLEVAGNRMGGFLKLMPGLGNRGLNLGFGKGNGQGNGIFGLGGRGPRAPQIPSYDSDADASVRASVGGARFGLGSN